MFPFEWNSEKNISNQRKHGIDFEQASMVFLDKDRLIIPDNCYDYGEERFITIGTVFNRIHVVVYCERDNDIIRMISARKANQREQKYYANR